MPPRAKKAKKEDEKPALEAPAAIAEHTELQVTPAKPAQNGQAPMPAVSELAVRRARVLQ